MTAIAQEAVPNAPQPATEAIEPARPAVIQPASENTVDQATTLLSLMVGALVLLLGVGIAMLWALRKSVVNEVATIVRTQLNEMTELENKVHNATRSLNRILADADDLSGELEGRSAGFQREIVAQREVLYNLVKELDNFKVQTAQNWQQQLEDINDKLEATAVDFSQTAAGIQAQAKQQLEEMKNRNRC